MRTTHISTSDTLVCVCVWQKNYMCLWLLWKIGGKSFAHKHFPWLVCGVCVGENRADFGSECTQTNLVNPFVFLSHAYETRRWSNKQPIMGKMKNSKGAVILDLYSTHQIKKEVVKKVNFSHKHTHTHTGGRTYNVHRIEQQFPNQQQHKQQMCRRKVKKIRTEKEWK